MAGIAPRFVCDDVIVVEPPETRSRIWTEPLAPVGVRMAIQYLVPETILTVETPIAFQAAAVAALVVPVLNRAPGLPLASA